MKNQEKICQIKRICQNLYDLNNLMGITRHFNIAVYIKNNIEGCGITIWSPLRHWVFFLLSELVTIYNS